MRTAAGPLGAGAVTLVEGSCFCISLPNGDIHFDHPHGLFVHDTRILSGWTLTLNDQPLEPLAAETEEPYRALFAGRIPARQAEIDSLTEAFVRAKYSPRDPSSEDVKRARTPWERIRGALQTRRGTQQVGGWLGLGRS